MVFSRLNLVLALVVVAATTVVSPASASGWGKKKAEPNQAQSQAQTQEYVDARMHETLASIDKSLNKLVVITRGGEPPRKDGIIGPTVAGAAGPGRPPFVPAARSLPPMDSSVLKRRVQIQWNGSAEELLRSMSQQLGFSFSSKTIRGTSPRVRLEGENLSVEQTLNLIASQLQGRADIVVSLQQRKIELLGR